MTKWDLIYLGLTVFLTVATVGTVRLFARLEQRS